MNALGSIHNYYKTFRRVLPMKNGLINVTSFNDNRLFNRPLQVLSAFFLIVGSCNLFAASPDSTKHWVGTWAASAYKATSNTPSKTLTNNTLRQIVRVSIGGDTLRVKFSNITFTKAITLKSVTIARSPDGTKCPVDASTIKQLKFKGDSSVTIDAASEVYSDPIAFNLTPSMRLAITTYYGDCQSSSDMTFHYGCRGNSYWIAGDQTASANFSSPTQIPMWFTICSVDVLAPKTAGAVVCFGNSITDGYGLTDGTQNRWTDVFSEKLLANPATAQVGVLNEGIGATNVLSASNGADPGTTRFTPDVLNQSGVRWIIMFYGVNDIGNSSSDITNNLTSAYKSMVTAAHAKSIKVYGATITPFKGYSYYDAAGTHEKIRQDVNKWIRATGNFDGVIDFDKTVQNPSDPAAMLDAYVNSSSKVHPSAAGYKAMGESIDLKLFATDSTATRPLNVEKKQNDGLEMFYSNSINGNTMVTFEISHDVFVSLKVFSILGQQIAEFAGKEFSSGKHTVVLRNVNLTNGTYIYAIKTDKFTTSKKMIFPTE
jgi:lysophospholipase L1-like esterase